MAVLSADVQGVLNQLIETGRIEVAGFTLDLPEGMSFSITRGNNREGIFLLIGFGSPIRVMADAKIMKVAITCRGVRIESRASGLVLVPQIDYLPDPEVAL
jgi:hypothetical protein